MLDWTYRKRRPRSALSTSEASDSGEASARPIPVKHAGVDAKVGIETGSMTPWLVHGLRGTGLDVRCLDARQVKVALQMRLNKTDENDAEGLAQIMRTGWYRAVHVKSLDAHRARALLGSGSARRHDDAAVQHDTWGLEDLRLAARHRSRA
jgi:transposase